MALPAIGLIGCGEMGAGMGARLVEAGLEVRTVLAGRGDETRQRAAEAGIAEAADLAGLVEACDLVISVLPPSLARDTALELTGIFAQTSARPAFLDANAISPVLVGEIAEILAPSGVVFIDGGIIGLPPANGSRPRLFHSGGESPHLKALDGIACDLVKLEGGIGAASAFKMAYAALTKGSNALVTAGLLLAQRHGLLDPYLEELGASQKELLARAAANVPRLPADAGRWVFEMEEIARTFQDAGLPPGFHEGAAEIMRILDASEFGSETRRTLDKSRTMRATIETIGKSRT